MMAYLKDKSDLVLYNDQINWQVANINRDAQQDWRRK